MRGECALRSPIPDLPPHSHAKLHTAIQRLMGCSLPLLAALRRPALLLPGPLQAAVKAQRIEIGDGEDYAGVWHEDGLREHVVAVVLYVSRSRFTYDLGEFYLWRRALCADRYYYFPEPSLNLP